MSEKNKEQVSKKEPVLKTDKFIVGLKGLYMKAWPGKVMCDDKKEAKVYNKANADYIAKEIKGKVIPV